MRKVIKKLVGRRGIAAAQRLVGAPDPGAAFAVPPVPEFVRLPLAAIEADAAVQDRTTALQALRRLGLDDFGLLMLSMPNAAYPKLSRLLPAMAGNDIQDNWTGTHGVPLLRQTLTFVRSVAYNYAALTGRSLADATILDYGCGYGRIARLMYYFVPESNFHGVDPWDRSIAICNDAGLRTNFAVSDYLPTTLPVGDTRFDLAYAFSVFTHLSERATLAALKTLRQYVKPEGLLTITIRPVEYWTSDTTATPQQKDVLREQHRRTGFAFNPHVRDAVDGEVTYGDTSLTLEWLAAKCPEWRIRGVDRAMDDEFQIYVFLQPA